MTTVVYTGTFQNDPTADNLPQAMAKINAAFAAIPGTGGSGSSAQRPTHPIVGQSYFDTDLGYRIDWSGSMWVNMLGAGPV